MRTYKDKLNELTNNDVWIFTKQSTSFDDAFKAVKLFSEMPKDLNVTIEDYFTKNYSLYEINTDRHRIFSTAQFYGLLTKSPFYGKAKYKEEKPTEVFNQISKVEHDNIAYNTIKTEQILKIKIRAIIDTVENNSEWHILPIIFSYMVLRTLKEKYSISEVSIDKFFTYVMTCSEFSQLEEAVLFLAKDAEVSAHINAFKDRSRILSVIKSNIELFKITKDSIAINERFDDYFYENFILRLDIDEMNLQLQRDVDYSYFLTTLQGFNVNLIDTEILYSKKDRKVTLSNDDRDDYLAKIQNIREENINEDIVSGAHKTKPQIREGKTAIRFAKNPLVGKIAIKNAKYLCQNNGKHATFTSAKSNKRFMEAHHLIPVKYQMEIWDKFSTNVDCIENIVSLCPNCHRAIHYANGEERIEIIRRLFDIKKAELEEIGVTLSGAELIKLYFGS